MADERSVRVQVFQATLLAVVVEALKDRSIAAADYQKLVDAILTLGNTYAWLNPDAEVASAVPQEDKDYAFLNRLWRLQVRSESTAIGADVDSVLQESVDAVGRLLKDVEDPVKAIGFLTHLIEASTHAHALKQGTTPDIRNATFLRELNEFGFEVVKVNPTTTTAAPMEGEFLAALWQGKELAIAERGLHEFFSSIQTTAKRVALLDYAERLIQAMQQVQDTNLQTQRKDDRFLSQLLNLGGAYAALDPTAIDNGILEPKLFLDTLWRGANIPKGTAELASFFADFATLERQIKLLKFERAVLRTISKTPVLKSQMNGSPQNIADVIDVTSSYALSRFNLDDGFLFEPSKFFSSLWEANTDLEMRSAANRLVAFINNENSMATARSSNTLIASAQTSVIFNSFSVSQANLSIPDINLDSRNINVIRTAISQLSTDARRTVLANTNQMQMLRNSSQFSDESAIVAVASLLEGSQTWNPVQPLVPTNFYINFVILGRDTPLTFNANMNCWEFILYCGFLAGRISSSEIRAFYNVDPTFSDKIFWERLGWKNGLPQFASKVPRVGDLVFFRPLEDVFLQGKQPRNTPGHVAISVGGETVIHLVGTEQNTSQPVRVDRISALYKRRDGGGLIQVGAPITRIQEFPGG